MAAAGGSWKGGQFVRKPRGRYASIGVDEAAIRPGSGGGVNIMRAAPEDVLQWWRRLGNGPVIPGRR